VKWRVTITSPQLHGRAGLRLERVTKDLQGLVVREMPGILETIEAWKLSVELRITFVPLEGGEG
jgi:hypothetical protein